MWLNSIVEPSPTVDALFEPFSSERRHSVSYSSCTDSMPSTPTSVTQDDTRSYTDDCLLDVEFSAHDSSRSCWSSFDENVVDSYHCDPLEPQEAMIYMDKNQSLPDLAHGCTGSLCGSLFHALPTVQSSTHDFGFRSPLFTVFEAPTEDEIEIVAFQNSRPTAALPRQRQVPKSRINKTRTVKYRPRPPTQFTLRQQEKASQTATAGMQFEFHQYSFSSH